MTEHYKIVDPETGIQKHIRTNSKMSTVIITGVLKPSKIMSIAPYRKLEGEVLEECTREEFIQKYKEYVAAPHKSYRLQPFVNI